MDSFGKCYCFFWFVTISFFTNYSLTDAATIRTQLLQMDSKLVAENRGLNNDLDQVFDMRLKEILERDLKIRVKRQAGAGKYTDAAKMPQVKLMHLILQMFKNIFDPNHVGGTHPFHTDVPKPIMELFVTKMMTFFFPPAGVPDKTQ